MEDGIPDLGRSVLRGGGAEKSLSRCLCEISCSHAQDCLTVLRLVVNEEFPLVKFAESLGIFDSFLQSMTFACQDDLSISHLINS